MRILTRSIIGLCGLAGLVGAPAASVAAAAESASVERQQAGVAIATVYHSMTGAPLAGMPVVVQEIIDPEIGYTAVFKTDENGRAVLGPLENGRYVAYVSYNGRESESVLFEINGDTDVVMSFSLFFNPDIDG